MRGDFSRIRFEPAKQYTAVLKQQGRVDLDADANEQCFIDLAESETVNRDVIGEYGAPENDAGFQIKIDSGKIWIGPGRYYVKGILVENPHWIEYDGQPYLIGSATAADLLEKLFQAGQSSRLGFVLEVWQRMVTALDDPCLLEPALGQADTTTRIQTVWRVVGAVVTEPPPAVVNETTPGNPISQLSPCCQMLYGLNLDGDHTGKMGAGLAQAGSDCGCSPIAAAGYQGLENQLYRVEIHDAGDLTSATFKWSRENGSVVAQVTAVGTGSNSQIITVSGLGPDANLGFQPGQWVELSDDTYQFGEKPNRPGQLYQIQSIQQATLQVTMTVPVSGIDTTMNARMRRWDQSSASATATGIPVSSTPLPLENGIQVSFSKGNFQSGDYWTIPARTANGQIDWPPCGSDGNYFQASEYMRVYVAPVACARARLDNFNLFAEVNAFVIDDCRLLFPPLTAVNAATASSALHVSKISWNNDDVMTVDTLIATGLYVVFDQATACPWGGGNFQVSVEPPFGLGDTLTVFEGKLPGIPKPTLSSPPGTDSFVRTVLALDPPWGITVSGTQVNWIAPASGGENYGSQILWNLLNTMLAWQQSFLGYARMRIRLIGAAVYGTGASGNIYLDGQSFGQTGTRSVDGSECVSYNTPSGASAAASDYEGWFYLAPTVYIASISIQGTVNNQTQNVSAVTVQVNFLNHVTGLQITGGPTVTNLQVSITLSYPPVAPVTVSFMFTGTGAGSIVANPQPLTLSAGQQTGTSSINIIGNPGTNPSGAAIVDTVTLIANVQTAVGPYPATTQPTLAITGTPVPVIIE